MLQLGDITKISVYDVPPVDVVIGGSPCQDLSVAGKRAGLAGERSSLFMEQIRIVKEMRDADRSRGRTDQLVRPRFMVWENVPGAFSSNKGEDFRTVLEETARVICPDAVIPRPPGGKWRTSGCILADGWSVAWRVLDAQFWGVPQRRRRIALVADFGGHAAPEILFVRKSVCGDSPQSGETRKGTAAGTGKRPDETDTECRAKNCLTPWDVQSRRIYTDDGAWPSLYGGEGGGHGYVAIDGVKCLTPWDTQSVRVYGADGAWSSLNANENGGQSRDAVFCIQGNCIDRSDAAGCNGKGWRENAPYTLNTVDRPAVYDARGNGNGKAVPTITGDHENRVTDYTALVMATGQANAEITVDNSPTLNCNHEAPIVAAVDCRNCVENISVNGTLQAKSTGGTSYNLQNVVRTDDTVRRLTPLECERLQGFPDFWTDIGEWTDSKGKKRQTSDAARYKTLGNSIALPPWMWVLKRLCACYERPATMASLFDGIGGFPLIWERLNGTGTCLWASEIEAFCVAVTKERFKHELEK